MSFYISLFNNIAVSLYGSILSVSFCKTSATRKNRWIFYVSMTLILLLQGAVYFCVGPELMRKIYPLVVHFPLVLMLYFMTGRILWPFIAVFTAYSCCELRRWFALLIVAVCSGGQNLQNIIELAVTLPFLLILLHFASPAVRRLSDYPVKVQFQFGVVPALYYAFDYISCVYTDLLFSGNPVVVEFMPFVCCVAYLAFLLYNAEKDRTNSQLQQIQNSLNLQLEQAVREISALRESQTLTRRYRHDMRHHLQYLAVCIENGQKEQAQDYISGICKEIEAQKVQVYCENEAANLILSSFAARAEKAGIVMKVQGALPTFIMVSESDLCVLLSNALENAIHACHPIAARGEGCVIDVQFYERNNKLFLQVTNPCDSPVSFEKGIPVTDREGHGIGIQSICAIVERYGGVYSFMTEDEKFILRLSL